MTTFKQFITEYKKFESEEARELWNDAVKRWKSTLLKIHSLYGGYASVRGYLSRVSDGGNSIDIALPKSGGWTADDLERELVLAGLKKFFRDDGWDFEIKSGRMRTSDGALLLDIILAPQNETQELLRKIPFISASYAYRKRRKK